MPTYDYVCSACGKAFERFQEMSAKKLRKCPACGKSTLQRQVGAGAGLIFKGSGFYITDYRRSPGATEAGTAPAAGGEAASGAGGQTGPAAPSKSEASGSAPAPAKEKGKT